MSSQNYIKFLGTAGARHVMARQLRFSAGVFIRAEGQSLVLDPGPGTLLRCARVRPPIDVTRLDAVVLTHGHLDHSGDANALIDAMTAGGHDSRGTLFAPGDCLAGENAVILNYLRGFLAKIVTLDPQCACRLGELQFRTSIRHMHPMETYGIRFLVGGEQVSFLPDTLYFPELVESYAGSDILVINVVRHRPLQRPRIMHLCLDEAASIISQIKPRKAVLTHFGMTMLRAKPWQLAEELSRKLGVEVLAASDGMKLDIG